MMMEHPIMKAKIQTNFGCISITFLPTPTIFCNILANQGLNSSNMPKSIGVSKEVIEIWAKLG